MPSASAIQVKSTRPFRVEGGGLVLATLLGGCLSPDLEPPVPSPGQTFPSSRPESEDPYTEASPPENLPLAFTNWPWLQDLSPWITHLDPPNDRIRRRFEGAYGMGNGRVFGIVGLGDPVNTLSNHTGPHYNSGQNFFGDVSITVERAGGRISPQRQWAWRVDQTAINGTQVEWEGGVYLTTVDFVPPDGDHLVRWIVLQNTSNREVEGLGLRIHTVFDGDETPVVVDGLLKQVRGDRRSWLGVWPGLPAVFEESDLVIPVGNLAPGQEVSQGVMLTYTLNDDPAPVLSAQGEVVAGGIGALLEQTRAYWQVYLGRGAVLTTPVNKVDDLIETQQVMIGVQTDQFGAVSPMSRYTKAWLRDSIGPIRFYSRLGRFEDAGRMLDYLYSRHVATWGIRNSVELAQDPAQVPEPSDPQSYWEVAEFMPGRNPIEGPSYLPLAYHQLWRSSGDIHHIQSRYEYLKACVERQEFLSDGRMEFSGDETFRYTLMWALGIYRDPTFVAWSANSNFLYVAAAEKMAEMASQLGKADDVNMWQEQAWNLRQATEALYWTEDRYYSPVKFFDTGALADYPFEDVATKPIYFGYTDPNSEHGRKVVSSLEEDLLRPDGTLLSPTGLFHLPPLAYTGMVPGLALYNFAATDHPRGELVFEGLLASSSPSGTWEELQWADHSAAVVSHPPSGRGASEAAARYRPWEGGENGEAILKWLVGLEVDQPKQHLSLSPHLPLEWDQITYDRVPLGEAGEVDILIQRGEGSWRVVLEPQITSPYQVDLRLAEEGVDWGAVRANGIEVEEVVTDVVFTTQSRVFVSGMSLLPGETLYVEVDTIAASESWQSREF